MLVFLVTASALNPLRIASDIVTPAMKPVCTRLAPVQAGTYDEKAARLEIDREIKANPVVVYTYELSPFCWEAVGFLKSLGVEPEVVSLGAEWWPVLLSRPDTRNELLKMTGQSSLPHVFVGGTSLGGLYSGTPGLVPAYEDGSLLPLLKKARAL